MLVQMCSATVILATVTPCTSMDNTLLMSQMTFLIYSVVECFWLVTSGYSAKVLVGKVTLLSGPEGVAIGKHICINRGEKVACFFLIGINLPPFLPQ